MERFEGKNWFAVAMVYALLGDHDKAIEMLNRAYEERSAMMVQLKTNPSLDSVRSNPRFQELLRRMNFPR